MVTMPRMERKSGQLLCPLHCICKKSEFFTNITRLSKIQTNKIDHVSKHLLFPMWGEGHTWEESCQSWHVFDTVLKTGVTWNPIIHRWTFCSQILMGYFHFLCRWRKWSLSGSWGQRGNSKANLWVLPAENRLEPGSQGTCSCWRHGEHDYIRETDTFGCWTVCQQN